MVRFNLTTCSSWWTCDQCSHCQEERSKNSAGRETSVDARTLGDRCMFVIYKINGGSIFLAGSGNQKGLAIQCDRKGWSQILDILPNDGVFPLI